MIERIKNQRVEKEEEVLVARRINLSSVSASAAAVVAEKAKIFSPKIDLKLLKLSPLTSHSRSGSRHAKGSGGGSGRTNVNTSSYLNMDSSRQGHY